MSALAYSHSQFTALLRQIARNTRKGTGKTFNTKGNAMKLDTRQHVPNLAKAKNASARQAVIMVRVEVRPQLVWGHLPIGSFRHLNDIIRPNTALTTLYPARNKRLPLTNFFSKSGLSVTNLNSF